MFGFSCFSCFCALKLTTNPFRDTMIYAQRKRGVAQLVARLLWEQDVGGSSPFTSTTFCPKTPILWGFRTFFMLRKACKTARFRTLWPIRSSEARLSGTLTVKAGAGENALRVVVFDFYHVCDKIGSIRQFLWSEAPCQNNLGVLCFFFQYAQKLIR